MFFVVFLFSFFFVFLFLLLFFFPFFKISFFFFDFSFIVFKFNFYFDNIVFSFVLILISVSVFFYSLYYMNGEVNFYYYYFVLLVFISSMFCLVFCDSVFFVLFSWDLLGISSFFLVLFYNNWDSCSGSMNTVLTNRIGDFFVFIFFSLSFFIFFNFFSFSYFCFYSSFFLVLAAFTKSAQFPFGGWLPKAMSAPTPVSSLVHSSTLVTAGIVLMIKFKFLLMTSFLLKFVLIFGVFTMFFSSFYALYEEDLKKVIALSTLSQMGLSMVSFGLGLSYLCYVHLLSHAIFKSCLFMQVGYLIHNSFGQQDSRSYSLGNVPFFVYLQILITLFCLCGLFFLSGSVSKDYILCFFFSNFFSFFFGLFFFLSIFMTFLYSYRVWKVFFFTFSSSVYYNCSSFLFFFISLPLVFFSLFFVWWLSVNFLTIPSVFIYFDFYFFFYFVVFFFFVYFFLFKFFSFSVYFFIMDYLPIFFSRFFPDFKYFDVFLNKLNFNFFSLFSFSSLSSLSVYLNKFNFVVFFVFLFFFMI
uniref:NADH:ubiquinone reductase (H(+)-translocating) n=1 Tax=Strongyloides sp. EN-2020c TaxID=2725241 RepID=A0A6J4CUM7_9BILA|nr:NADH dehydrogenase subunit 5 [Strongyloides sp. EN-2020c]